MSLSNASAFSKDALDFFIRRPFKGLYEFDLVNSKQKLQMVKLGRKKYNRHLRCLSPVSRTRCWFKGKTFELSDGKRTQVFFFSRKKRLDKSQNIKKNGFLWRMSDGKKMLTCFYAIFDVTYVRTFWMQEEKKKYWIEYRFLEIGRSTS